jgi:hypothetical protein
VQSLEIDPVRATATLGYRIPPGGPGPLVRRFAAALRRDEALAPESLPPWQPGQTVGLRRYGRIISTLDILFLERRRLEARHWAFGREPALAHRI